MKTLNKLALFSTLLIASTVCMAQNKKPDLKFAVDEISPGLYMLAGDGGFTGGNIGLSIGEDGVVMIDDSMPPFLEKLQGAIKSVTSKPIDFLISTHVHGDHMGNNEAFSKGGTHIVAHENFRKRLIEKGMRTAKGMVKAPKGVLPVITFSEEMSFHLNGDDVQTFHVADAHTDGDAIVYFKNANVVHTGDTYFNNLFPFIDLNSGGGVDGYIAAQEKVLSMVDDKTKIIPGHGPLASKKELAKDLAMLKDSRNIIAKLVKRGKSEDEVVKMNPLAKYHDEYNWGFITTEKMTRQVYSGLKNVGKGSHYHTHQDGNSSHIH